MNNRNYTELPDHHYGLEHLSLHGWMTPGTELVICD